MTFEHEDVTKHDTPLGLRQQNNFFFFFFTNSSMQKSRDICVTYNLLVCSMHQVELLKIHLYVFIAFSFFILAVAQCINFTVIGGRVVTRL